MERIKYLLVLIISVLLSVSNVYAESSKFEATVNMEPEITENQINLTLGFRGEEIMAISGTLTYDSTKITLLDVVSIDNFDVTVGSEVVDGKWHSINILADSEYSFKDTNYAIVVFEIKSNFRTGKNNDIFIYDVEAVGPEKAKYRYSGDYLTLTRATNTEMQLTTEQISKNTRLTYFIKQYILIIIIGIVIVVSAVITVIMMIPSRRKIENRTDKVSESLKKENYNPNDSNAKPITLNQLEIDKIGAQDKVIDLSDAIVVSDVKPFGDIIGKEEAASKTEENVPAGTHSIESVMGATATSAIDPFNVRLESESENNDTSVSSSIPEITNNNQINEGVNLVNPIPAVTPTPIPSPSVEGQNGNELKSPILTVNIETSDEVEDLSLEDDDNNSQNTPSGGGTTNIMGIILLLTFVLASLFSVTVKALEDDEDDYSGYRVDDLRNCIVGNIPDDPSLDYNEDGVVDIVDLMYTRNTIDVNFEKLISQDPGFKEIHGESPNILGQKKTTTKIIVDKKSTTIKTVKKSATSKRTTTKKTTTKKTTTKKTTTKKGTTTKKSTTSKSTTSRTTTSKKTTTKKSTTSKTTTTKATYQVSLSASHGTITSANTVSVVSGSSGTFTVVPQDGYRYVSVDCGTTAKGTYTAKTNVLKVSYVKDNSSCVINFTERKDIKVVLNINNDGALKKATKSNVVYNGTAQFTLSSVVTAGYEIDRNSISCPYSFSIDGTYFTINGITNDVACSANAYIKRYDIVIYDPDGRLVGQANNLAHNTYYSGYFTSTISGLKMHCTYNGANHTTSLPYTTETFGNSKIYTYTYKLKMTADMNCRAGK